MKFKIQLPNIKQFSLVGRKFKGQFVDVQKAEKELERLKSFIQYQNKNRPVKAVFIFDDEAGQQLKSSWQIVDAGFNQTIIELLWHILETNYADIPLTVQEEIVAEVSQAVFGNTATTNKQDNDLPVEVPQTLIQPDPSPTWQNKQNPAQVQANLWGVTNTPDETDDLDLDELETTSVDEPTKQETLLAKNEVFEAQKEVEALKAQVAQEAARLEALKQEAITKEEEIEALDEELLELAQESASLETEHRETDVSEDVGVNTNTNTNTTPNALPEVSDPEKKSSDQKTNTEAATAYGLSHMTADFLTQLIKKRDYYSNQYYKVDEVIKKVETLSLDLTDD